MHCLELLFQMILGVLLYSLLLNGLAEATLSDHIDEVRVSHCSKDFSPPSRTSLVHERRASRLSKPAGSVTRNRFSTGESFSAVQKLIAPANETNSSFVESPTPRPRKAIIRFSSENFRTLKTTLPACKERAANRVDALTFWNRSWTNEVRKIFKYLT